MYNDAGCFSLVEAAQHLRRGNVCRRNTSLQVADLDWLLPYDFVFGGSAYLTGPRKLNPVPQTLPQAKGATTWVRPTASEGTATPGLPDGWKAVRHAATGERRALQERGSYSYTLVSFAVCPALRGGQHFDLRRKDYLSLCFYCFGCAALSYVHSRHGIYIPSTSVRPTCTPRFCNAFGTTVF